MSPLPPARQFSCPTASGAIYDHGAQVVSWVPAGQESVIWGSREARLDSRGPIRGGIPICWPWFGFGRGGLRQPQHGFARLAGWSLLDTVSAADAVSVTYQLAGPGQDNFDQPYQLTYAVSFGRQLSADLTVRNVGRQPFSFEEALHTYLRVGDVRQIDIVGLDQAMYSDRGAGADPSPRRQVGDLRVAGEVDRVYQTAAPLTVIDPVLERRLVMTRRQSANVVVWNPWIARAKVMPDFGDDEWTTMVCTETANVEDDAIELEPGEEHTIGFTLAVEAL